MFKQCITNSIFIALHFKHEFLIKHLKKTTVISWFLFWCRVPFSSPFPSSDYSWILGLSLLLNYPPCPPPRWQQFAFWPAVSESAYYSSSWWAFKLLTIQWVKKGILIAVFICISLIMNKLEHLFMCLMTIRIALSDSCLVLLFGSFSFVTQFVQIYCKCKSRVVCQLCWTFFSVSLSFVLFFNILSYLQWV